MNHRDSPLYWSISCGTWFATQVRLSVWFPLVLFVFGWRLGWEVGLAFGVIYFVSVLFHEFGHVVGARLTGGAANEILIWPLGGLAMVQPGPTLASQFLSTAAGPLVNAALCIATLPAVLKTGNVGEILNPFVFPHVDLHADPLHATLLMVFVANWVQFLINLIPVYPLDGGRLVQTTLSAVWGREGTQEIYILIGFLSAFGMMFAGLLADSTWLTSIAAVVLVLNFQESVQMKAAEGYDESFMGYDFSQGYTSLEKSAVTQRPEPRPGWLERWKRKRRAEKERQARETAAQLGLQVDALLQKVHEQGIASLSSAERAILKRAGEQYRGKDKPST